MRVPTLNPAIAVVERTIVENNQHFSNIPVSVGKRPPETKRLASPHRPATRGPFVWQSSVNALLGAVILAEQEEQFSELVGVLVDGHASRRKANRPLTSLLARHEFSRLLLQAHTVLRCSCSGMRLIRNDTATLPGETQFSPPNCRRSDRAAFRTSAETRHQAPQSARDEPIADMSDSAGVARRKRGWRAITPPQTATTCFRSGAFHNGELAKAHGTAGGRPRPGTHLRAGQLSPFAPSERSSPFPTKRSD